MRTLLTLLLVSVMITLAQDKKDSKDAAPITQISKEDQYHLRAINAELTTIQTQINQYADQLHAQDKVKERAELTTRVCGAAKIPLDTCSIDTETGKVTEIKKPTPVPQLK